MKTAFTFVRRQGSAAAAAGGAAWGAVAGVLSDQTDLAAALANKVNITDNPYPPVATHAALPIATGSGKVYLVLTTTGIIGLRKLAGLWRDSAPLTWDYLGLYGRNASEIVNVPGTGSSGTDVQAAINDIGGRSTDGWAEGATNKYFTTARVLATALTGVSFVSSAVVTATDTVLSAIGTLQAQISSLTSVVSGKLNASAVSAFGLTLVDDIDATAARTTLALGNVNNTSDAAKPVSTATQTALDLKIDDSQATATGLSLLGAATVAAAKTILALVKGDVGLANVDNTSDAAKPVSTATQTALNAKAATAHTHVAADVTDFPSAARAQTEAELVAGANITITPSGVGATRQLSIAATVGSSGTATVVAGRTYRATNQLIPAGTAVFTLVEFSTVGMAVGGTFFNPAFPTEGIIPEAGVFEGLFKGSGEGTATPVTWELEARLVGGGSLGTWQFMAAANAVSPLLCFLSLGFTAGQKITIGVKHNNATALNLLNAGDHSPQLIITKQGGAKGDAGSAGVPAGATTQVQFNNAGAFAGDADFAWDAAENSLILGGTDTSLTLQSITNEPAAPSAGRLKLYAKSYAGRVLPKIKGPSGLDFPLQTAVWGNKGYRWQSTSATAGVWEGTVGAGAGTFSRQLPTTTSLYTTIARARWANVVTTLNQVLGQRNTEAVFFRGSLASQGGFFFFARCGFDVWANGGRFFAGMHTATTVVSADPSALNNTVGFCIDAADNGAISFLTRGTVATKAPTGLTAVTGKGYDVYIFCAPNSAQYEWRIVDINTQVVAAGVATLNLPTNTVMMTAGVLASNAALATVTAIQLGCDTIYAETDF